MFETLPQLICENYKNHPENQIQLSKNKKGVFVPVTYKEFYTDMTNFAAGDIIVNTEIPLELSLQVLQRYRLQQLSSAGFFC